MTSFIDLPRILIALVIIAIGYSSSFAGMDETQEQIRAREAEEGAAGRQDSLWAAEGAAAIPGMIRSLCTESKNIYLHEKAKDRLTSMGVPALEALFRKQAGMTGDNLCESFGDSRLADIVAYVFCNSERFFDHGGEWKKAVTLLRKKFEENPEDGLSQVSAIAELRRQADCTEFPALVEECLPMISAILRGSAREKGQNVQDIRNEALMTVASIGPAAAPLVNEILPFLNDPRHDIAAAKALEEMGPSAAKAAGGLQEALRRDTAAAKKIAIMKALGAIGPAAMEALPDIKRITDRLVDNACDGRNRQQLEAAVGVMTRLASARSDFKSRFFRWRTGCSDGAIVKVLKRELGMAHRCRLMPVSRICNSIAGFGKAGASASRELIAFVSDYNESIETRGAAARALEATDILHKNIPRPIQQIPTPDMSGIPDSSSVPMR
jgi:hypothetical protein